jgi:acetyl-CoA C-acetyltransferase
MKLDREIWIAAGLRTPFAKAGQQLAYCDSLHLSKLVLNEMHKKESINPDYVIWGTVIQNVKYSNIAREAVMDSTLDERTISFSTILACSSSLVAAMQAASMIREGQIAIAGGVESPSNLQIAVNAKFSAWLKKWSTAKSFFTKLKLIGGIFSFGIDYVPRVNRSTGKSMGEHAQITDYRLQISKPKQDELAVSSHKKYFAAKENGFFDDLIFPIDTVKEDKIPRKNTSVQSIAHLKPAFDVVGKGTITAGNSSLYTDGAAGVWVAGKNAIDKISTPYKARLLDWEMAGVNIEEEGILMAPTFAIPKLLERNRLKYEDIDIWEIHEAFASQVLATIQQLENPEHLKKVGTDFSFGKFPMEKLNINGGSIAIGHPFGATGARILSQAAKMLHQLGTGKKALISVCADGGLGAVVLIEN